LDVFVNGQCPYEFLFNQLSPWMASPLPSHLCSWKIASQSPFVLLKVQQSEQGSRAKTIMTININKEMKWSIFFKQQKLTALLNELPIALHNVADVTC